MDQGDGGIQRLSSGQERAPSRSKRAHAGEAGDSAQLGHRPHCSRHSAGDNGGGRPLLNDAMMALDSLRRKMLLCDAVLRTEDGGAFHVHRAIMTASSIYFKALFTSSLSSGDRRDVVIPGVTKEHMGMIIEYAYTRQLRITDENVTEVLVAADQFGTLGMIEECVAYIEKNITVQNCFGVLRFARSYFCEALERSAFKFIMKHFPEIADTSPEYLTQPVEVICEVLTSETLNVRSEDVAWEAALRWIRADAAARKKHVVELLRTIRLGLLDFDFFVKQVKNHEFVTDNEGCRPLVYETLSFLYDLETIVQREGELVTPHLARPRIPHEVMFVIGGWSGGSPTNYIETYDTRADRWVQIHDVDPAGPRAYHGLAVIGACIFVIGGFDGMVYFNSCRKFDASTRTWTEIAPMNYRRCYVSVVFMDGFIYALGGYDGHHRQNTCERYNPATNQWSLVAPMNNQRSDASASVLNGKIYITGGFNGQQCLASAEVYNPAENTWSSIPQMNSMRSGVSCIAHKNKLYVLGGFNGQTRLSTGELFDPATGEWSAITDMYHPRSNFATEVIDDLIFAIGGFNGVTTIYHVECYDEKTKEWYEATDMNLFRSALAACVLEDLPNTRDYIHQHRENLMEETRQRLLTLQATQLPPAAPNLPTTFPFGSSTPPPLRPRPPPLAIENTASPSPTFPSSSASPGSNNNAPQGSPSPMEVEEDAAPSSPAPSVNIDEED